MALVVPSRPLGRSSCSSNCNRGVVETVVTGERRRPNECKRKARYSSTHPPHTTHKTQTRTHLRQLGQVLPHVPQPLGELRARGHLQVGSPQGPRVLLPHLVAARGHRGPIPPRHGCEPVAGALVAVVAVVEVVSVGVMSPWMGLRVSQPGCVCGGEGRCGQGNKARGHPASAPKPRWTGAGSARRD
jgi:hypothetical protein